MLASVGLQWCQHKIERGCPNTAKQRKLLAPEKLSLDPGFNYIPQILLLPSKCAEDDFGTKSLLPWKSIKLNGAVYTWWTIPNTTGFFPMATSIWYSPDRYCCNYWSVSTKFRNWNIYNIQYFTLRNYKFSNTVDRR